MKLKINLKTIRFTTGETKDLEAFVTTHPGVASFSKLVRAALREYIKKNKGQTTVPPSPSFLWEYQLHEEDIFDILGGPQKNRLWLEAKILEHGKWEEVWHYLTRKQIEEDLPFLRLPKKTKSHWQYAINRWRQTDENFDPSST